MASPFLLTLCLGMLATCLAVPITNIRWCVKSEAEYKKCKDLSKTCSTDPLTLSCIQKSSTDDCIKAIAGGSADAATMDTGDIYSAALHPYGLKPIMAENYGTEKEPDTCYYAVALVKKSSNFMFNGLMGKRSCHTAVFRTAGWIVPIGRLTFLKIIPWDGPESQNIEKAVSGFFTASCAPGAKEEKLCKQCIGLKDKKCTTSGNEPYYGYEGARKCLKDDKGDVAFLKHDIPVEFHKDYELLCMDNTRLPISEYEKCSWGRVPSHAVMCVNDEAKAKAVTDFLLQAQSKSDCKLFDSSHGKDLMFKDSSKSLIPIPFKVDAAMYLGKELTDAIKAMSTGVEEPPKDKIRWCTQSKEEKSKCDTWTIASEGAIECVEASLAEECITKILKGDADAVTLDGGYLYTAGVCGLVPAMAEIYNADQCKGTGTAAGSYYAVALVKASDKTISWNNLKDKKSCHTGVERTAGWVIPAGLIKKEHGICDLSTYFKESCAPGANVTSSLCKLCAGDQKSLEDTKCSANNKELYYGYHGALRCLVEKGDVAFVKDATIFEAIKDAPDWLKNKKLEDYRLLCRDGSIRPVTEYKDCHLALVPSHVVATTPTRRDVVVTILKEQQRLYGRKDDKSFQFFNMFDSAGLRDLLFKSTTQCLREVTVSNMNDYLGQEYLDAVSSLSSCAQSELLKACTFHTCKPSLKV